MKGNRKIKYQYIESTWRHQQLSDEKIQFIYVITSGTIHDKRCSRLKEIPDRDIICLRDYEFHYNQCRDCAKEVYIHIGAKDPGNCKEYKLFFDRTKATLENVRFLYMENRMKTKLYGNAMKVWFKEDMWIIQSLDDQGNVQLKHNNYHRNPDGSRYFTSGFHIQNESCRKCKLKHALNVIAGYDYQDHFKKVTEEECFAGDFVTQDNVNIPIDSSKESMHGKNVLSRRIDVLLGRIKDFICSWKL